MRHILLTLFILLQLSLIGQTTIFRFDSLINRKLNSIGFPNQKLQDSGTSNLIFVIVYHDKKGKIDSIITSTNNEFAKHVKSKLLVTDGYWKVKGKDKRLPIMIPFIFYTIDDDQYVSKQRSDDILNMSNFPKFGFNKVFQCVFWGPVLVIGTPRIY